MKKLLYATLCSLLAVAFWQCKDDPVWESPAIGLLGSSEVVFLSPGGTNAVRFSTTAGWSVSVKNISGATNAWCTVSPMSGGAGQSEIEITGAANDTYEDNVAEVTIRSGGATQTISVTVKNKAALEVPTLVYDSISHEGATVSVPVVRNVDYNVVVVPSTASSWITYKSSKSVPIEDTIYFTLIPYTDGLKSRTAQVIIENKTNGLAETVEFMQLATPKLIVSQDTLVLDGKKQTNKTITLQSSADWTFTPDQPSETWCTLAEMAGEVGETTLTIDVTETLRTTREVSFTLTADTMVRKFVVKQLELGEENGVFVLKAARGYSTPSVIGLDGNNLAAFYVANTEARTDVFTSREGASTGPWDLAGKWNGGKELAQHMPLSSAVKGITVGGCTWSNGDKNANGFGGEINVKIYIWKGTYAASVAGTPIKTHLSEYNDGESAQLLPAGYILPAGDYLVCMTSTHPSSGVWISTSPVAGFDNFVAGESSNEAIAEYKITFAGQATPAAFVRKSTDKGTTWGAASIYYPITTMMGGANTSNLKVAHVGGKVVATFNKTDGSYWAQAPSIDGAWTAQTASGQGEPGKAAVQWAGITGRVSMVEFGGSLYAYYLDGSKLMCVDGGSVATASFAGKTATVAYVFADMPFSADVQLVSTSQLELLWINEEGKPQDLLSTSATTFTGTGAASEAYVFPGAKWLSRLSGADGLLKKEMIYLHPAGIYFVNK